MTAPTITIRLDPKGRWSSYRFEFCNALEDLCDLKDNAKAIEVLESFGVHVLDENGQERSSIVPGKSST